MSGIPGGGLIGEMLIVSLYGFPNSAFTIIATIGWLIDDIEVIDTELIFISEEPYSTIGLEKISNYQILSHY